MVLLVATPIYGIMEANDLLPFGDQYNFFFFLGFLAAYVVILILVFGTLKWKQWKHKKEMKKKMENHKELTKSGTNSEDIFGKKRGIGMFLDNTSWFGQQDDDETNGVYPFSKHIDGIVSSSRSFLMPHFLLLPGVRTRGQSMLAGDIQDPPNHSNN